MDIEILKEKDNFYIYKGARKDKIITKEQIKNILIKSLKLANELDKILKVKYRYLDNYINYNDFIENIEKYINNSEKICISTDEKYFEIELGKITEYTIGIKDGELLYETVGDTYYTIEKAIKEAHKYIKDKREIIICKDEYLSEYGETILFANNKTEWKFLKYNKKYLK